MSIESDALRARFRESVPEVHCAPPRHREPWPPPRALHTPEAWRAERERLQRLGLTTVMHDLCEDAWNERACVDGCERAGDETLNGRCARCSEAHTGDE